MTAAREVRLQCCRLRHTHHTLVRRPTKAHRITYPITWANESGPDLPPLSVMGPGIKSAVVGEGFDALGRIESCGGARDVEEIDLVLRRPNLSTREVLRELAQGHRGGD